MAQKHQILLLDDIDGSSADETIEFGLDGAHYEIDLNAEHAQKLRDAIGVWIAHSRKSSRRTSRRSASAAIASPSARIRQWAREQGIEISDRGRVPSEIREQYNEAHGL